MYQPFDAMGWINETFAGKEEEWKNHYQDAKVNFIKQEELKQLEEQRHSIRSEIEDSAVGILEEQYELFYLFVRYFVAKQLVADLQNNVKFQSVDTFALEEKLVDEGQFQSLSLYNCGHFF